MTGFITTYGIKILGIITIILIIACIILSFVIFGLNKSVLLEKQKIYTLTAQMSEQQAICDKNLYSKINEIKQLELDFIEKSAKFTQENIQANRVIKETIIKEQQTIINNIEQAQSEENFDVIWVNVEQLVNKL